jgi:hypothetical protein
MHNIHLLLASSVLALLSTLITWYDYWKVVSVPFLVTIGHNLFSSLRLHIWPSISQGYIETLAVAVLFAFHILLGILCVFFAPVIILIPDIYTSPFGESQRIVAGTFGIFIVVQIAQCATLYRVAQRTSIAYMDAEDDLECGAIRLLEESPVWQPLVYDPPPPYTPERQVSTGEPCSAIQ